jgi:hypothetical protein
MGSSTTKQLVQKGSGGKPDIYVDPEAIRAVVTEFKKHLPTLYRQIQEYKKDANTAYKWPDFGVMTFIPETGQIPGHYEDMRKKNFEYLDGVFGSLMNIALALDGTQQGYDIADGREPTPLIAAV